MNKEEAKMQVSWLHVLACLCALGIRQVKADDESGDQMPAIEVNGTVGERLVLVIHIERLQTCHFVFTEENSSEQCCYNLDGREEDCDISEKYTKPNGRCLEEGKYVVSIDRRGTKTCNLTIESVTESSAGHYKSYTADDDLIQYSIVKVIGQGAIGPVFITVTVLAILLLITLTVVAVVYILSRQKHIGQKDGQAASEEGSAQLLNQGTRAEAGQAAQLDHNYE